jgi:hypothetical protein
MSKRWPPSYLGRVVRHPEVTREIKEAWRKLREIIASLRSFLDTDDYSRIDRRRLQDG